MRRFIAALVCAGAVAVAVKASAQTTPPTLLPTPSAPPGVRASDLTSLEVHVVITRLEGGKAVRTLPYTLAVTANAGEAQLNMGADVPVPTTTFTPAPAATAQAQGMPAAPTRPLTSITYRPLGTAITCRAARLEDGRYQVVLSVDDSAIVSSGQAAPAVPSGDAPPVFRSFRSRNTLMLTDGQTRQYTAASDPMSGEVARLEVTLRVVK